MKNHGSKAPFLFWILFEAIAVTLWLTQGNIFYLFNFTYIGTAVAAGLFMRERRMKFARRFVQIAVGLYMLVFLGFICNENMQIEGFFYYLFTGVFAGATIHYLIAKIGGPVLFGRGWCGYACWTAMILDLLPFHTRQKPRKNWGWARFIVLGAALAFSIWVLKTQAANAEHTMFLAFVAGNLLYYASGIALAFICKDNRAFCKYLCPVSLLMKPGARISLVRVKCDEGACIGCGKCTKACPMDVDMLDGSRSRANGTECILCMNCIDSCPVKALDLKMGK